ncbi:MAG: hypothetical protein SPI14_06030 [Arcanobacterium sp.]|nr:hypothetical protein [Arcanobacterium sp.]
MNLLDGRDTVTVHVGEYRRNEWGMIEHTDPAPHVVRCSPQWVTVGELTGLGITSRSRIRIIARHWPGTPGCRIQWGRLEFRQVDEAKRFSGSPRTAHVEVDADLVSDEGLVSGDGVASTPTTVQ